MGNKLWPKLDLVYRGDRGGEVMNRRADLFPRVISTCYVIRLTGNLYTCARYNNMISFLPGPLANYISDVNVAVSFSFDIAHIFSLSNIVL